MEVEAREEGRGGERGEEEERRRRRRKALHTKGRILGLCGLREHTGLPPSSKASARGRVGLGLCCQVGPLDPTS
jgi:hypothetical protein